MRLSRQEGSTRRHLGRAQYYGPASRWKHRTSFSDVWRAGLRRPVKHIVHWIGCINAIKTFFCKKSPVDSAYNPQVKNFVKISRSISEVNAFYAEVQDGRQRWRENEFCENLPVHSADALWVKNFVEFVLSRSISEINMFFPFSALRKIVAFS